MNATSITTRNHVPQAHPRYSPPLQYPLKQAAIANGSLKINLHRLRRDLVGAHKLATVDRLLDVNAAVARSLEWLSAAEVPSGSGAPDDCLEQLAMELQAVPDAVEVSAQ